MRVLGIDPGIERTGFAIIEAKNKNVKCLEYGCIYTDKHKSTAERILAISKELSKIIKKHKPKAAGVEDIFFFKNLKTAVKVSEARGAIMLVLAKNKIKIAEFTPLQVKMSLVGYGRAEKKQVQEMLKTILNLHKIPQPDDAADAIAISICTARELKLA